MLIFVIKRLGLAVAVAIAVSIIAFLLLRLAGDVATALTGPGATQADIEAVRERYGLDRPVIVQYIEWLMLALQGDLGTSIYFDKPVAQIISERIGTTMTLGALALLFAITLAVPAGIAAGARPNSWIDRAALGVAVVGQAMPSFWFALLLMLVFGVHLQVLPISGSDTLLHFVMPAVALGYYATPAIMRLTRAGMIEVLGSDYIRTARAKGLLPGRVLFKHALRNAIVPVVALAAVQFGFMLGGSIVIETIFSLHGVGYLGWISIARSDFPVVQGIVLMLSVIYVLMVFLADILNAWLDPRIRTV